MGGWKTAAWRSGGVVGRAMVFRRRRRRVSVALQGLMINNRPRFRFLRRALGVGLCYALAFQAFLAANSNALALGAASDNGAGFVICHNAGDGKPAGPDTQTPVRVPCAACALAASASALLPALVFVVVPPSTVAGLVRHADTPIAAGTRPARAGLARAPPHLA